MTTDTLTLTAFLEARIAEDEAVALAALRDGVTGPQHSVLTKDEGEWSVGADAFDDCRIEGVAMTIYDEGGHTPEQATHIARHDPARVLATCKAHRAIVEAHKSWPVLVETPPTFDRVDSSDIDSVTFRASQQIMWATEQEYRARFGSEPPTAPMLRALADIWSDHPDYAVLFPPPDDA